MPRTAILYIAERCNQSCVFCLEEDGTWNEFVDPSTQEVIDTLERLRGRGADHITFMGGETFFRKDLPRILFEAKKRGYTRVGVTTNGTVLSKPGFLSELVKAGLDFIEFSIHGHTPELANAIGGTHFTYERQAAALAEIDTLGDLKTIVNVVACRENVAHLLDVATYVSKSFPRIPVQLKFKFTSLLGLALRRADEGDFVRHEDIDFEGMGDALAARGAQVWFYNVPLCRLGRHAAMSHELETLVAGELYFDFDHHGRSNYNDSGEQLEGRVYPESSCGSCVHKPLCPGVEEPYRQRAGAPSPLPIPTSPIELARGALARRAMDPALAEARLAALSRSPRPARFVRGRADGAVRFLHDAAPEPLDLTIDPANGQRAFRTGQHYALSYRRWSDGDPSERPDVRALLDAAALAFERADGAGLALERVRALIGEVAVDGWKSEPLPEGQVPRKKRIPLPLLGPMGDPLTSAR
jgi:organic radical activating enzyme